MNNNRSNAALFMYVGSSFFIGSLFGSNFKNIFAFPQGNCTRLQSNNAKTFENINEDRHRYFNDMI